MHDQDDEINNFSANPAFERVLGACRAAACVLGLALVVIPACSSRAGPPEGAGRAVAGAARRTVGSWWSEFAQSTER